MIVNNNLNLSSTTQIQNKTVNFKAIGFNEYFYPEKKMLSEESDLFRDLKPEQKLEFLKKLSAEKVFEKGDLRKHPLIKKLETKNRNFFANITNCMNEVQKSIHEQILKTKGIKGNLYYNHAERKEIGEFFDRFLTISDALIDISEKNPEEIKKKLDIYSDLMTEGKETIRAQKIKELGMKIINTNLTSKTLKDLIQNLKDEKLKAINDLFELISKISANAKLITKGNYHQMKNLIKIHL